MKKNSKEIWRDIPGYEGYYQASDEGRVRSLDRWIIYKNGRKRFYKGKIFEGSFNNGGYKTVNLSRYDKQKIFQISQLVAMAFLYHEPNGHTLVIDHINGIKTDNNIKNLRVVTHRDNTSTCYRKDRNSLSSDFAGVSYNKPTKKWRSMIRYNGLHIFLGYFENEIDASNAYKKALSKVINNTFNPDEYKPSFASKSKGVYFNKNNQKWLCQPNINGNRTFLGYYSSEEEAHQTILLFESAQPIKNYEKFHN